MTQTITNIKNQLTGALSEIVSLKEQMEYHVANIAPKYNDMQEWEANEYQLVHESNIADFNNIKSLIMTNEAAFNEILFKFKMSASVFIASL